MSIRRWISGVFKTNILEADEVDVQDTSSDPTEDGEITRNGADVKVRSGGTVYDIGTIGVSGVDVSEDGSVVVSDADDINFEAGMAVADKGSGEAIIQHDFQNVFANDDVGYAEAGDESVVGMTPVTIGSTQDPGSSDTIDIYRATLLDPKGVGLPSDVEMEIGVADDGFTSLDTIISGGTGQATGRPRNPVTSTVFSVDIEGPAVVAVTNDAEVDPIEVYASFEGVIIPGSGGE